MRPNSLLTRSDILSAIQFFQETPSDILSTLCAAYHREQPIWANQILPLRKVGLTETQLEHWMEALMVYYHAIRQKVGKPLPEITLDDVKTEVVALAVQNGESDESSHSPLAFQLHMLSLCFPERTSIPETMLILWFSLFQVMDTASLRQG